MCQGQCKGSSLRVVLDEMSTQAVEEVLSVSCTALITARSLQSIAKSQALTDCELLAKVAVAALTDEARRRIAAVEQVKRRTADVFPLAFSR